MREPANGFNVVVTDVVLVIVMFFLFGQVFASCYDFPVLLAFVKMLNCEFPIFMMAFDLLYVFVVGHVFRCLFMEFY